MPDEIRNSTSYPYTVHVEVGSEPVVDRTSFSFTREGVCLDEEVQAPLKGEDIRELQNCMIELLEDSEHYDFVATFALGGVFPLNFMARALEKADSQMPPGKFHLFPGLLWEATSPSPKSVFLDWLNSLSPTSKVLVFDTGNDGNAGGRIRNVIRDFYEVGDAAIDLEIDIKVIATRNAKQDKPTEEFRSSSGRTARVDLKFLWVGDNPFEDAVHFIGYESLRQDGLIKATKFSGGVVVEFETHKNALLSTDTAGAFMELFLGKLRLLEAFRL